MMYMSSQPKWCVVMVLLRCVEGASPMEGFTVSSIERGLGGKGGKSHNDNMITSKAFKAPKKSKSKAFKTSKTSKSKSSKSKKGSTSTIPLPDAETTFPTTVGATEYSTVAATDLATTTIPPDATSDLTSCLAAKTLDDLPTILSRESLTDPALSGLEDNPATACATRFDFPNAKVAWYEVISDEDPCFCVELRSIDNAFIIGVLQDDDKDCEDLNCIAHSDFTSESIAWRASPLTIYKLAVSVLPGGPTTGTYQLNVVKSGSDSCPEETGSSVLIPGGCPLTQCYMVDSDMACKLVDNCSWCDNRCKYTSECQG